MRVENGAQEQITRELASMRQRIDELEALQARSLQLTSSLDLSSVLETIAESAVALVGASDCLIYLYDQESESYSFGTAFGGWVEVGKVLAPRPSGLTATVIREGRPVVIDDAVHHPLYAGPEAQQWNIQAIAGFPLRQAGRILGVLHVVFVVPHAFSEDELRVLGLLADQAAIAIENSQLYSRAQREIAVRVQTEEELRRHRDHLEELVAERTAALTETNVQLQREIVERKQAEAERERLLAAERGQARRQSALLRLSAELGATLDEAEVCRRVVDGLRDTLGYDNVVLFLINRASGDRVMAASVGFDEPPLRVAPGQGLSEGPLLDGQLHYTPDVSRDPRYLPGLGGSEVDVPIRIGGDVAGVLVAENRQPGAFDQADFEVLTAASQQAGLAIEKARLLAAERQRADELDALRTTMADITAELALPTLLHAIVERAAGLVNATGGELGLYDPARQEVRIVVSHNLGLDYVGTCHALGEGAMGLVAESGEPLIIRDYQAWEGSATQYAGFAIHAVLAAPLNVGERLVGVITLVTSDADRQFDAADLHLLTLFGQQAAIAIENARLFGETERRVTELATLTDVGKALSSALHVDEVLQLIYAQTRRVMHADDMLILLLDPVRQELECVFSTNPDDISLGTRLPSGTGLVGQYIVKHRRALLLSHDVPERASELGLEPAGKLAESWLGVPIIRGEQVLGVIIVQHYSQPGTYDKSHQDLLESIASQAAIAIENARLFEQAQKEIAERERVEAELRRSQEYLEERVEERTAKLRESEERYRTLFDGIPVGLYRTTPGGENMDVNLALAEMMGYPSREDYLQVDLANVYVDPKGRQHWQALMQREGVVRDFETLLRRADGTVIWANDTARAVRDEQGQVLYYEGSLEDITSRKETEEELRKYQEHLEELVEARTAELQESEVRYRTLFDGVPIGLYRTTPTGQILDVNLAAADIFGYPSRDQAVAEVNTADVYVDPGDRARWQALMEREGLVRDFEEQVRCYDGRIAWLKDTARAVKDEQGRVLYYEGSLEDITERKQFEEEIRRQKDYFEALFLNSPVAVVTADLDAKVVSWNPMAEKLFGYTEEEAIGSHIDDLVTSDASLRAEAKALTDRVDKQERVQVTTRRNHKDGSPVDVELLALPLILAGEWVGFYGIYHDISERKRIERELRRQKEYYEALFVNSPVAVVTADLDSNIVSWNPMAERLFGYRADEVIGNPLDDVVAAGDSLREEARRYTEEVITLGRVQGTTKRSHRDGSALDVELLALPVVVSGERVGFIVIYVDISDLQNARRQAEAANQAKSTFLANMSHELRTPLNAILGFSQLMDGDPNLSGEQQENLAIINRSGEHLLALINDVLEMSKIEAGRVTLQEDAFDLYSLLDTLEEMFRLRAEGKGLTLSLRRAGDVPQYVVADEAKLRQILSNLLGNAVKFTQDGGVVLRTSVVAPCPGGPPGREVLRFEVEDTGPGIAPEELEAVFEPFVQARGERDLVALQAREGTGLGLSISRQFVRLMGGDITASSEVGRGSLFQFELQVGLADTAGSEAARPGRRVLGLAPNQGAADGRPYRLLVVEDKETNRRLLVRLLASVGFEVQEAADGQAAIELWERWRPHLIWMDMRMPVMDGHEATRRIRATPQGRGTTIIALTATAFEEDREQILLEGCDDFVRKPFRKDEIFDILAKYLGVRFLYDEEPSVPHPARTHGPVDVPWVEALAALPAGWLAELQQATTKGDLHLILSLIDQVRGQNAALADALAELAQNYGYRRILALIEQSGESR